MVHGVAPALAFTGGALAVVGTTLYWARVADPIRVSYVVRLPDLSHVAAPMAVLWVVLLAGGLLVSRGSSVWSSLARLGIMISGTTAGAFVTGLTLFLSEGTEVIAHTGTTDEATKVVVWNAVPDVGLLLYLFGLALVVTGAVFVEIAVNDSFRLRPLPTGGFPLVHRLLLVAGVVLAAVSLTLPWYRTAVGEQVVPWGQITPDMIRDDAQAWLGVYRVGFLACLVITVLALIWRRHAVRLRLVGVIVGTAVLVMLATGYLSVWQKTALPTTFDLVGAGFHLAAGAMLLITVSLTALPARTDTPQQDDEGREPADEQVEETA
ncbi:hypothetical protein Q0Z83_044970 [Actinoplanes sichuanensis]|nr:hypothetical protein Q0Z83_044970 [Actinoplanes sichuanensis]